MPYSGEVEVPGVDPKEGFQVGVEDPDAIVVW
jgi:hypothetical protein